MPNTSTHETKAVTAVDSANTVLLTYDNTRTYFCVHNAGTGYIYIGDDSDTLVDAGFPVGADEKFGMTGPGAEKALSVRVEASGGNHDVRVIEA